MAKGAALALVLLVAGPDVVWAGVSDEPPYQALAERLMGRGQGIFAVAEDGTVLASVAADRPVHPASVSKVPSTLALLRGLGPRYRFATRLRGAEPRDGTVAGDLVIEASGDPFLLPQSAAYILAGLDEAGVGRVGGRLRVDGPLFFNWKPDPGGKRLQAALAGRISQTAWRDAIEKQGRPGDAAARKAAIAFGGKKGADAPSLETLLVHLSPPLPRILKELNAYSNNIIHPMTDAVGGATAVERVARASVPPSLADEIVITNAAGLGKTNRLSPRAAVEIQRALGRELARHGLTVTDVLPVAGRDRGTLERRFAGAKIRGAIVGKTGTLPSQQVSALAGVARTERFGDVTFAILNQGIPVLEARRRQDRFLTALLEDAGAVPFAYDPLPSPILAEETVVTRVGGE